MSEATKENPGAFINSLSSAERKEVAVARGLYGYFPDALALVARHSVRANEKHNPGQPVHWSREKSSDHEDCIARHSLSIAIDPDSLDDGQPHIVCRAWRALAALQIWAEGKYGKPAAKSDDGWHDWKGGDCPVDPNVKVEVWFRGDIHSAGISAKAASWAWFHSGDDGDIIKWRRA